MKIAKASGTLGLLALATMVSPMALAQETGWYFGANLGQSAATIDDAGITRNLIGQGLLPSALSDRDRDTGYKLFGGYQFNNNLALEGGYFNLGQFGYTANTVPAGTLNGDIKIQGLNLDLVGRLPITEKVSLIGRVGANYADSSDTFRGTGAVRVTNPNPSKRELNGKLGVGVEYAFNESLAMRVEAERYRVNDAIGNKGHVDLISVGLVYRFGARPAAPVQPMAAWAPEPAREVIAVAPPPPPRPEPAPVAQPPAPRFEKYSLSATELFGFDSDLLHSPQPKLDEIASAINSAPGGQNVVITGYTDHLGSAQYNQKLSERRAHSVKNYLAIRGVDTKKLIAEGKGEVDPVVVCTTMKRSELIKCLEPNRRVEIAPITLERRIP